MSNNPAKIILFNCGGIGDAVLGTRLLVALHGRYPGSQLDCVVSGSLQQELVQATGLCKDVFVVPTGKVRSEDNQDESLYAFVRRLRKTGYNIGIITYQSRGFWNSFLCRAGGCKTRCGALDKKSTWFLNRTIPIHRSMHVNDFNENIVKLAGVTDGFRYPEIRIPESVKQSVDLFLEKNNLTGKKIVFLHGGSGGYGIAKRVPDVILCKIAEELTTHNPEVSFVFLATDEYESGSSLYDAAVPYKDLSSVLTVFALLQRCELCISSDSGPIHMAAMAGTPVIGLFGPTDPEHTGPIGDNVSTVSSQRKCSPCLGYRDTGRNMQHLAECSCLMDIDQTEVINKAMEILQQMTV